MAAPAAAAPSASGPAVFAAMSSTASLGVSGSSIGGGGGGAYSFEALQRARSQSSGALLGNLRKPLSLTFRDLDVWVTKPSRQWFAGMRGIPPVQQQVLNRVNGGAQAGEMLAIMGPSGGGKTTLLNVLSGRHRGRFTGEVAVNGRRANKADRKYLAFVLQDDILFAHLTVRETLTYTALLRLPRAMPKADKLKQVDYVIEMLGLTKCVDTKIGNVFSRGISGGERKRTSIASELLTNPSILMLDEPTSGLDASMALGLVTTLRSLARNEGRTVLCSIHQPSSQIFEHFDRLLLLADGQMTYNGPISQVVPYFAALGYTCPEHYNPADFIMALMVDNAKVKENCIDEFRVRNALPPVPAKDGDAAAAELATTTTMSVPAKDAHDATAAELGVTANGNGDMQVISVDALEVPTSAADAADKDYGWEATWLQQFWILTRRSGRHQAGVILSRLNLIQMFLMSIIVGLLWFQIPLSEPAIADRYGLVFFLAVFWSFQAMIISVGSFPFERAVITKERLSRSYRLSAYFFSKSITEMLIFAVLPFCSVTIAYLMAGLSNDFGNYVAFVLIVITSTWALQSVSLFIGSTVLDFQEAITTGSTFMLTTMLLGGFYVRTMPSWLVWAKYLSITNYAYPVLMNIEFSATREFTCDPDNSAYAACTNGTTISGTDVVQSQNLSTQVGLYIGVLFIFIVGFRALAYLALRLRKL